MLINYPPGTRNLRKKNLRIILEYHGISGDLETKTIDLLDLAPTTEVRDTLVSLTGFQLFSDHVGLNTPPKNFEPEYTIGKLR